jgi:hypothetical protein
MTLGERRSHAHFTADVDAARSLRTEVLSVVCILKFRGQQD